jgi:hypothetical protein
MLEIKPVDETGILVKIFLRNPQSQHGYKLTLSASASSETHGQI